MVNSISFGFPHVLRAHMWALSVRSEPNEIKGNHPSEKYYRSFHQDTYTASWSVYLSGTRVFN